MFAGNTPFFVADGVSADVIRGGEPRLRRSRSSEDSWFVRAGLALRRLRPAAARVPVLGR